MKNMLAVILFAALAGWSLVGTAQVLYVQSVKADLLEAPTLGANPVATLARGEAVEQLATERGWVQVRAAGSEGWVSRLLLNAQPPRERVGVISGEERAIEDGARRRASAVTTAGATRGLSADERSRGLGEAGADFEALARLEAIQLSEAEVLEFLHQGVAQ